MIATLRNTSNRPASLNRRANGPRAELLEHLPLKAQRCPCQGTSCCNPPVSSLRAPAWSRRRGISLLEVLIAVFVLTFGLMSVAMVIPAGRALMVEASKSDRSSACGRAALNDVQIREWHNPWKWRQKWGPLGVGYRSAIVNSSEYSDVLANSYMIYSSGGTSSPTTRGLIYGETYFVDPYFSVYLTNENRDSVRHFPYSAYPWREIAWYQDSDPRQSPERALARRVHLGMGEALAKQLTTWSDELIFSLEADNARPRQSFTTSDGQSWAFPAMPGDGSPSGVVPLQPTDMGRFTWAAMITPLVPAEHHGYWDHDNNSSTPGVPLVNPDRITKYEIAIVVFYNRVPYCPTADPEIRTSPDMDVVRERSVYAQVVGDGIGGGDVFLFVEDNDPARPTGYLNVKKNDWIMLKGLDRAGAVATTTGPGGPTWYTKPNVCKWYRVVTVDEILTTMPDGSPIVINDPDALQVDGSQTLEGRGRYVTLVGPDWQVDTTFSMTAAAPSNNPRFDPATDIAEAALVDDVVGVYTTVVDTTTQ